MQNESLLLYLTAQAIRHNISFTDFKTLAEFLECYNYVLPDDRGLLFDVTAYLVKGHGGSKQKIFQAWLNADLIETCLTEKMQHKLLTILYKIEG